MVDTKIQLQDYIKRALGYPVVNVELDNTQIDDIIDSVIQKYSDFAMGGSEAQVYQVTTIPGVLQYTLDARVQSVFEVRFRSNNFSYQIPGGLIITPSDFFAGALLPTGNSDITSVVSVLSKISMLEKYFDVAPAWDYNDNTKILTFFQDPSQYGSHILLELSMAYSPKATDMIYDHQWIKDMSVAKCKYQLGVNVGKYNGTLVGGASINYGDMKTEALADIERLNQELITRWSRPLGIYRG